MLQTEQTWKKHFGEREKSSSGCRNTEMLVQFRKLKVNQVYEKNPKFESFSNDPQNKNLVFSPKTKFVLRRNKAATFKIVQINFRCWTDN